MTIYWKDLLDYLEYDPTEVELYIQVYNDKYGNDYNEPKEVREKREEEVIKEVRKYLLKKKIKNFWEG